MFQYICTRLFFSAQDITSFDFHESLATLSNSQSYDSAENVDANSSQQNIVSVTANEVVIEVDPLNDHECMAHLVKFFFYFSVGYTYFLFFHLLYIFLHLSPLVSGENLFPDFRRLLYVDVLCITFKTFLFCLHQMRLIEFMRDEKIYNTENVQKLPGKQNTFLLTC